MVCEKEDEAKIEDAWLNGDEIPDNIKWKGIITLEDIMEDLIQEQIADEFDTHKLDILDVPSPINNKSKTKWTDDESFAESTFTRYSEKNKRTARAVKNVKIWQNRSFNRNPGSQSDGNIVTDIMVKPLLSNISVDKEQPSIQMDSLSDR